VIFIHVTLLPYIKASKEMKSKPTQHSVRDLMSYGIIPDFLVLRSDYKIPKEMCEKVSRFCNIKSDFVIPAATVKSVYQIPLNFQKLKM
jgi:CTP synthase